MTSMNKFYKTDGQSIDAKEVFMKILITGGTGNLGSELVRQFSKNENAFVVFTYYNNIEKASELSKKYGAKAISLKTSFDIDNDFDIIINNAGIVNSLEYFENVDIEKWNETIETNLTLPFKIIKINLPHMKKNNFGRIINISSIYGLRSEEGLTPYIVSKHGLIGLTRAVAKEYGAFGITCNAVCPGVLNSDLANRLADYYTNTEEERIQYFKTITDAVPNRCLVETHEVAELVYTIAFGNMPNLNGAIITLDGGDMV